MDWAREQLDVYVGLFMQQALQSSTTSFQHIANCVEIACTQSRLVRCYGARGSCVTCLQLLDVGLDVEFMLWDALHGGLVSAIDEEGRNWLSVVSQVHHITSHHITSHHIDVNTCQAFVTEPWQVHVFS